MPSIENDGFVRAASIAALIVARAEATPDAYMLFDERARTMTFAEYERVVRETAAVFAARGVRSGDVVAWQLPTRIETIVAMGALARLGATQVPILPIHRERELRFMLAQTAAQFLCVPGIWRGVDYLAMAEQVRNELGTFEIIECAPSPTAGQAPVTASTLPPAPDEGDSVRWVFYSSGTTADPKGAMHVDRAAMASARGMCVASDFRSSDRYGVAFPFTHIGGLTNLCGVLSRGYALILVEVFDPAAAVAAFARHGATIVGGGPAFYRAYLEQQRLQPGRSILPNLRFMVGGGAPMPAAMHKEVREEIGGAGVAHGYGMTESCSIVALNHPADTDEKLCHTSGRMVAGMRARVVRADETEAPCGDDGEIRLQGEFMMVGYRDSSLDTDAFDDAGWFRTGDVGSIDADGYVRVSGRIKDIIIRKGENVSAKEIEELLYGHPAIADVAVIGLPDDERGELVCAVIVPKAAAVDLASVSAFLDTKQLMRQKYPERVENMAALPRNASGKVTKRELIRRFGSVS